MKPRDIFLSALRRGAVPRPATGSATSVVTVDLMERVGVFFPEAHRNAEKMAALAAAGYTELGFDNVMPLFSVWHESSALGCKVDWGEVDRMPGCREPLCKMGDAVTIPADFLDRPGCKIPLDALRLLCERYGDEVAVVGKVFGPWTLGYHVFGVQEFLINTLLDPEAVKRAMAALKEVTVRFARAQIEAGADALCLADHATRDLCSPDAYRDFLKEIHEELNARIPCPLILHICGDTSDRIGHIRETGLPCFHFDSKVPAAEARRLAGDRLSLMGGTGNLDVIQKGTPEQIIEDVREKVRCGIDVIGPECAVPLDAPCANMKLLAAEVKACRSGRRAEQEFRAALERVTGAARRHAERSGLALQPDDALRGHMLRGLARNLLQHGRPYCPCREVTGDRTTDRVKVCPCRSHRYEIARFGECECGLFVAGGDGSCSRKE